MRPSITVERLLIKFCYFPSATSKKLSTPSKDHIETSHVVGSGARAMLRRHATCPPKFPSIVSSGYRPREEAP